MNYPDNNYSLNQLADQLARKAWNRSNEQMMERARLIRQLAENMKGEVSLVLYDQNFALDKTKKLKSIT